MEKTECLQLPSRNLIQTVIEIKDNFFMIFEMYRYYCLLVTRRKKMRKYDWHGVGIQAFNPIIHYRAELKKAESKYQALLTDHQQISIELETEIYKHSGTVKLLEKEENRRVNVAKDLTTVRESRDAYYNQKKALESTVESYKRTIRTESDKRLEFQKENQKLKAQLTIARAQVTARLKEGVKLPDILSEKELREATKAVDAVVDKRLYQQTDQAVAKPKDITNDLRYFTKDIQWPISSTKSYEVILMDSSYDQIKKFYDFYLKYSRYKNLIEKKDKFKFGITRHGHMFYNIIAEYSNKASEIFHMSDLKLELGYVDKIDSFLSRFLINILRLNVNNSNPISSILNVYVSLKYIDNYTYQKGNIVRIDCDLGYNESYDIQLPNRYEISDLLHFKYLVCKYITYGIGNVLEGKITTEALYVFTEVLAKHIKTLHKHCKVLISNEDDSHAKMIIVKRHTLRIIAEMPISYQAPVCMIHKITKETIDHVLNHLKNGRLNKNPSSRELF